METKIFEIRDRGTFIPVMATQIQAQNDDEKYLLSRAGFSGTLEEQSKYVFLIRIDGGCLDGETTSDSYEFGNRTMQTAHSYIEKNFNTLQHGQVIDVEFILGETQIPKVSESSYNNDCFD